MKLIPVGVVARFESSGALIPLSVTWKNGRVYPIDAIIDRKDARSGSPLVRYTVRSHGHDAYLYRKGDLWLMEEG